MSKTKADFKGVKRVDWRLNTTMYEVNIRQYTPEGTFRAFAEHLPRLKDMGIETLWLMPITPIAKKNMKGTLGSYYACSDYTAINPEFGTLADFKALVKKAHSLNFKLIIDWVANHTGWDHVWTETNPDFYKRDEKGAIKIASGMDDIIELNYQNPRLVKAMIEAMQYWVKECDIDGFRCDLSSWVALDFWKQARPELDQLKPLLWLGEMDAIESNPYLQVFDIAYAWTWMHVSEAFYKKDRDVHKLVTLLRNYNSSYPAGATGLFFSSNHDENSWNGTEYEKYGEMALLMAVLSCTSEGLPLIYSGQELPNTKRLLFFDKDVIEWKEPFTLHEFYKKLLTLRRTHPALTGGNTEVKTEIFQPEADEHIIGFLRTFKDKQVLVLLNFSPYPTTFTVSNIGLKDTFSELFSGEKKNCSLDQKFQLNQWGYKVYVK